MTTTAPAPTETACRYCGTKIAGALFCLEIDDETGWDLDEEEQVYVAPMQRVPHDPGPGIQLYTLTHNPQLDLAGGWEPTALRRGQVYGAYQHGTRIYRLHHCC